MSEVGRRNGTTTERCIRGPGLKGDVWANTITWLAKLSFCAFGDMVGELRESLCVAYADSARNANPSVDALADGTAALGQIAAHALQPNERFVNAVDLLYRAKPCGEAHHAVTHVAIKYEVRTQGHQAVGLFHVADLEPWGTHFDTQGFEGVQNFV